MSNYEHTMSASGLSLALALALATVSSTILVSD
jgi:hypothetical protein